MSDTNRITVSLGFITAFTALFFGADFIPENRVIFILKLYAVVSCFFFFLYLLFTAISYKYTTEKEIHVGLGYDEIYFSKDALEKIRQGFFNAAINCLFHCLFIPIFVISMLFTTNMRFWVAILLAMLNIEFFHFTLQSLFALKFFRTVLLGLLTCTLFAFSVFLNLQAQKVLSQREVEKDTQLRPALPGMGRSSAWTLINYIADGSLKKRL